MAQLDADREEAGRRYETLRRKLVRFLGYWGCSAPEDSADEAISRVARKIEEGEGIENLHAYALRTAQLVHLEVTKAEIKERKAFEQAPIENAPVEDPQRKRCYDRCLAALDEEERDLIVKYYAGPKAPDREKLSLELGKPIGSLRVAAFRIRQKLATCHENCLNQRRGM